MAHYNDQFTPSGPKAHRRIWQPLQSFHSQEWSISKCPCSLTRNITSHSMKNLAFHHLLRWKMIILPIPTTFLFKRLGECTFLNVEWKRSNLSLLSLFGFDLQPHQFIRCDAVRIIVQVLDPVANPFLILYILKQKKTLTWKHRLKISLANHLRQRLFFTREMSFRPIRKRTARHTFCRGFAGWWSSRGLWLLPQVKELLKPEIKVEITDVTRQRLTQEV